MLRFLIPFSIALTSLAPLTAEARACGQASFYGHGDGLAWQRMANGKPMNPGAMITAHRSLPFGTKLRVVNQRNGKSVVVTVSDDGPHVTGRVLDLSPAAFARIASLGSGLAEVCFSRV